MPIQKSPYLSARERRRFAVIMVLPDSHPARVALIAFYQCRVECVGFELCEKGDSIDQEWFSPTLNRRFRLSSFLYEYISHDSPPFASWGVRDSDQEQAFLDRLPMLQAILDEGRNAARNSNNPEALQIFDRVARMFRLLECAAQLASRT
jgi:hypothetical protein